MASLQVYSLLDRKLREFGPPFCERNEDTAKRFLNDSISAESVVGKYPEDFDLYRLGEFDPERGLLHGDDAPLLVANIRVVLSRMDEV